MALLYYLNFVNLVTKDYNNVMLIQQWTDPKLLKKSNISKT